LEEIIYHKATLNDLDILVDFRIEFLIDFWGPQADETKDELRNHLIPYFQNVISDDTYVCYIATCKNDVVGIGGMILREQLGNFKNPTGRVAYFVNMYTIPSFRKLGICSHILEALVADAKNHGIKLCELHATKEGAPVYIRNGFQLHPEPTYRKYI
jgi:GNAT superfamily N-acetyltransferase